MFSDYEKNGYVIIDDLLPEHMYNKINDVCRYAKDYEEVTQIRQGRYEIWKTENDKNFPSENEDYLAHMWDSKSILKHEIFEQVFEDYIKPRMLKLTENKVDRFMHQANKYQNDGKDFIRLHYDDYMGLCGYIFYVNDTQWKYDWGGLLHFTKDNNISTILPNPNRLVLTNHGARIGHWVTPTNTWALAERYVLTGFSLEQDRELPETWRKRIDE